MKKVLILLVLLTTIGFSNTVVKGYELGAPLKISRIQMNTLGGISGAFVLDTLNDGRVYMIGFIPSEDGASVSRVYASEITRLVNGLSKKYNINLVKIMDNSYSDDGSYYGKNGDLEIIVEFEYNRFFDIPYTINVSIWLESLRQIRNVEKQNEANTDF